MKIEKKVLNEALRMLGKVVCQTSPVELYRSVRFVGNADGISAMATDGIETVLVLIDAITAKIYRIKNETTCRDGIYGRFRQFHWMPMLDYPLFLTDAAIFRDGLENFKYAQTENKE